MKKLSVLLLFFVFFVCQNVVKAADELTVVETISSPDSGICGLAWDSGYLWGAYHYSYPAIYNGMILKFDMSGNVITSFEAPGYKMSNAATTTGLAFDGTYLWNINYSDDKIFKITTSGEVVESFDILNGASGLAWDGQNLWVSSVISYKIYKINPENGEVLHSVNSPGWESDTEPDGLAYDGSYLWISTGRGVFKISPESGLILEEYKSLGYRKADGLTWDGQYLWVGGTSSSAVKKLDVGFNLNSPIANAGPDQIVFGKVILDGSQSSDEDGSIVSYQWQLYHKENSAYNKNADGKTPTVSNLEKGFYEVTLTVTDNDSATAQDTMLLCAAGKWDINDDNKLGMSEVIYILQILSDVR